MTIFFWTLLAAVAFAILLAAQMRILLSIALRRALAARFGGKHTDPAYRSAIYLAGRGEADIDETKYLHTEFPRPLAHLNLARQVSLVAPALLLGVFLLGRFVLGVV